MMKSLTHFFRKITLVTFAFLFAFLPYGFTALEEINWQNLDFSAVSFEKIMVNAVVNDPTEISDLVLWLDGSDTTTLNTDVACTTNVASAGDRVQCWEDKSGQGNNVTQSATADSPFYRDNEQNSLSALEFDDAPSGNDDRLITSTSGQITANGSYTKFVVFKYDTTTSANNLISSTGGGSILWGQGVDRVAVLNADTGSAPGHLISGAVGTANYRVAAVRYENIASNGELSVINIDGTEADTDDTVEEHTSQIISIGAYGVSNGLNGKIAEAIVYDKALTDMEIDEVECYLGGKWGITVTSECVTYTVSQTALTIDENAGEGTFTVVLDQEPTSDVVFDISSDDTGEATVLPATLTFTTGAGATPWNVAQTVTVTGIDDLTISDDTATITVAVNAAGSDNDYDLISDKTVAITLTDEEAFTPDSPTDFGNLVLWLDGEDVDGDGLAEGLSEAGLSGSEVATWVDKSGQGNNVTGTSRPTLNLAQQNGKPTLDFASDNLFTSTAGQITANGSYTKFVVFKYDTTSGANNLISSAGGGSILWGQGVDRVAVYNASGPAGAPGHLASGAVGTANYRVAATRYENIASNGELSVINIDGTQADTDDTVQNHTSQVISIGAYGGANWLDGKIAEAIVYNGALTDVEIDCVEAYLGDKWGITVSNAGSTCASLGSISLTKAGYPQYKVFQRDGSDQYDFALAGTYGGTCSTVEASFAGAVYTTIDATPTLGTFSGTLSDQGIGQGRLSVRCSNDISAEDGVDNLGIGDVYVVAGQSNAEGHAENQQVYTTVAPTATVFPTVYTQSDIWKVGNDDTDPGGGAGSVWPIVGGYIAENTGVPVSFITTATGGTNLVTHWQPGNAIYERMPEQVNEANPNNVKAVLWFQGESDASNGISRTVYNAALDQLILDFQAETSSLAGADLVSGNIGPWIDEAVYSTQIRLATQDAWSDNPLIKNGPQTYDIDISADGIGDAIHFVADDEIQTLGFRWWKSLEEHYYGGSEGQGPQVSSAQLLVGNTQIDVDFTANSALQGGTSTAIWFVDDNGTDRDVTSAIVFDADTVRLTLAEPITSGTVTLTYAKDNTAEGEIVLTDSVTGNTAAGVSPLPADVFSDFSVIADNPSIEYVGSFSETVADDGTVSGSIVVTLTNDTFVNPITLGSHLSIVNLPSNFVAGVVRDSATQLTISLTGSAIANENSDDVNDLTITFLDGAFTTTATASSVVGYQKTDGNINFLADVTPGGVTSGLTLWLDADDESTLYTEAACINLATTGQDVGCWQDKSGQAHNVTGTSEPTILGAGLNGRPTLDFASDSLDTVDGDAITSSTSYTKFAVVKYDTAGANNIISSGSAAGGSHAFWSNGGTVVSMWHGGTVLTSGNLGTANYQIGVGRYGAPDAVTNVINVDGTQSASNTTIQAFNSVGAIQIGSHGTGASKLDGKLAEVLVYDRALDDAEVDAVECYLGDKWGITVSSNCDTTPPVTPIAADLISASDTGSLDSDDITNDDTSTFDVVCSETGSAIDLYADNGTNTNVGTVNCTSIGVTQATTSSLSDDTYVVTYTETDAAGNPSSASPGVSVEIDTLAVTPDIDLESTQVDPVAITTVLFEIESTDSISTTDVDVNSFDISSSTAPGATITGVVTVGSVTTVTITVTGDGDVVLNIGTIADFIDVAGNAATTFTVTNDTIAVVLPASSSQIGGSRRRIKTKDVFEGLACPSLQILTQNLRAPARNGSYDNYTGAIVTEVEILQAHMNRLRFNSGPEDGILGPLTDGAIKRMQAYLGTYQDGYVGPITRSLINNSCTTGEQLQGEATSLLTTTPETPQCFINYTRLITPNTTGEDVKQVQTCMNSLGYTSGPEDGIYGFLTYKGVTEYQRSQNLEYIDGIVGPETSALLNVLSD